ncbi:hypothetical protein AB0P21_18540 [Kribbella sp. NPDC056861]|uniref:hypothetical protein n=1 Tax=Kribbella sp. NPDC056861 TaxID=3154857 RepID=UPI003449166E
MEPSWEMTGADRAIAAANDPDGYFAQVHAESKAAAVAELRARDKRRALEVKARLLRLIGLGGLNDRLAGER